MNKKPVIIFSTADQNNFPYAVSFFNSLSKFHDPLKIDMILYTNEKRPDQLKRLPKGVQVADIDPYLKDDQMFWYRQKPILSEPLLDDYDLVIGMDCDQLVLGDLSYIWDTKDYDVATVINWNRYDPQLYGFVQFQGVFPVEYFNCGLVALRSKKFAHDWRVLCFTPQFDRCQYKEQDLLNAMCYFGNWNVRCLDHQDSLAGMNAWWGMIGKAEWQRAELKGDNFVVPQGFGDTPFPTVDTEIKVAHMGGGAGAPKDNWGAFFNEACMKRINELIK